MNYDYDTLTDMEKMVLIQMVQAANVPPETVGEFTTVELMLNGREIGFHTFCTLFEKKLDYEVNRLAQLRAVQMQINREVMVQELTKRLYDVAREAENAHLMAECAINSLMHYENQPALLQPTIAEAIDALNNAKGPDDLVDRLKDIYQRALAAKIQKSNTEGDY